MRNRIIFIIIISLGIFLRVYHNKPSSFFADFDELYTVKTVSFINEDRISGGNVYLNKDLKPASFYDFFENAARDNGNNFLYNFVLSIVVYFTGFSDGWLRFFSCVCDIVSLLLLLRIGKLFNISSNRLLFCCLLFAINPVFVSYSYVIRAYSFSIVFVLISFVFFSKLFFLQQYTKRNFILFILSCFCLFLCHFLTFYMIGVYLIFIILNRSVISKKQFQYFLIAFGAIFIMSVVYLIMNQKGIQKILFLSKNYSHHTLETQTAKSMTRALTMETFFDASLNYLSIFYGALKYQLYTTGLLRFGLISYVFLGFSFFACIYWIISFFKKVKDLKYQLLFFLTIGGIISSITLTLVSGHLTAMSVKYSMFSLPFLLIFMSYYLIKKSWLSNTCVSVFVFNSLAADCSLMINRGYKKITLLSVINQQEISVPVSEITDKMVVPTSSSILKMITFPDCNNILFYRYYNKPSNTIFYRLMPQNKKTEYVFADKQILPAPYLLQTPN